MLRAQWGKLSQSKLSRQTGITQKQLSALETGKTKAIAFETLAKLCEIDPDDNMFLAAAYEAKADFSELR